MIDCYVDGRYWIAVVWGEIGMVVGLFAGLLVIEGGDDRKIFVRLRFGNYICIHV